MSASSVFTVFYGMHCSGPTVSMLLREGAESVYQEWDRRVEVAYTNASGLELRLYRRPYLKFNNWRSWTLGSHGGPNITASERLLEHSHSVYLVDTYKTE